MFVKAQKMADTISAPNVIEQKLKYGRGFLHPKNAKDMHEPMLWALTA